MTEILSYVQEHPFWTLIYLCVLTSPFIALAKAIGRRKR